MESKPISDGVQLKTLFGLNNIKYVYIQKVRRYPARAYVITFNSRRPNVPISHSKLRESPSIVLKKYKRTVYKTLREGFYGSVGLLINILLGKPLQSKIIQPALVLENLELGIPERIEKFSGNFTSNTLFIRRDLASDFFGDYSNIDFEAVEYESILEKK